MSTHEVIWGFLTGGPFGYVVFTFAVLAVVLLSTLVFQAACALADVETPNFFFSLLLVVLTLAVCGALNGGIIYAFVRTPLYQRWLAGWMSAALLFGLGFVLCVIVSAALYIPILRIGIKKSVLTGLFEQLLGLLLFALIYGALSVLLAVLQLRFNPPKHKTAVTPPVVEVAVAAVRP